MSGSSHILLVLVTSVVFLAVIVDGMESFYLSVSGVRKAVLIDRNITQFLQRQQETFNEPSLKAAIDRYLEEANQLNDRSEWISENASDNQTSNRNLVSSTRSSDPLNSFQTMRRLTLDVTELSILLAKHKEFPSFVRSVFKNDSATLKDDVTGTALSIFRLQNSYMLLAEQLTRGEIGRIRSPVRLTVADCLMLGQIARQHYLYDFYLEWTEQAHKLCRQLPPGGACEHVTEFLLILAIHEHDEKRKELIDGTEQTETEIRVFIEEGKKLSPTKLRQLQWQQIPKNGVGFQFNEQDVLCNGNSLRDIEEKSKLTCFYLWRKSNPSLSLYRYRVERQSIAPEVVQIHDFISEEAADFLRSKAQPHLETSRVLSRNDLAGEVNTKSRLSNQAWIFDSHDRRVKLISRQIERVTGLSLEDAEPFQVANYGTGGHYGSHYDYLNDVADKIETDRNTTKKTLINDRIATFIVYLNEVDLGGNTAFPLANAAVRPKTGSATFWYNLDAGLTADNSTLHCGCPVLYGEKWIANKWFRQDSQMFHKPCPVKLHPNTKRKLTD